MKKKLIVKLLKPSFLDINITFDNDKSYQEIVLLNKNILDQLNIYKNKIETEVSQKKWDYSKKLCNKYDLIHICSNKLQSECNNISSYNPISRSYYKLWEILHANKDSFPKSNIKIPLPKVQVALWKLYCASEINTFLNIMINHMVLL